MGGNLWIVQDLYKAEIVKDSVVIEKFVYEKVSRYGIEYRDMELSILDRLLYPIDINDVVSLVPFSKMLELKERVSIRMALKRYYEDLRKLINVGNLYIGNIGMVISSECNVSTIQTILYNQLLLKDDQFFLDLDDYNTYDYLKDKNIGDIVVSEELPFTTVFNGQIPSIEMPKRKVLEMYKEKFEGIWEREVTYEKSIWVKF